MNRNDLNTPAITHRMLIRGHVQGVGFRWSLRAEALALGLKGWVRNRRDGSVEALIQGPQSAASALIDWAHRGPPGARVLSVEVQASAPEALLSGFEQRPTA